MSNKYRKKPVVIEAMQLKETNIRRVYEWVYGAIKIEYKIMESNCFDLYEDLVIKNGMNIPTLEDGADGRAKHVASISDWVIKGIQGEFYPCKPDIFEATYEAVE